MGSARHPWQCAIRPTRVRVRAQSHRWLAGLAPCSTCHPGWSASLCASVDPSPSGPCLPSGFSCWSGAGLQPQRGVSRGAGADARGAACACSHLQLRTRWTSHCRACCAFSPSDPVRPKCGLVTRYIIGTPGTFMSGSRQAVHRQARQARQASQPASRHGGRRGPAAALYV